MSFSFNSLATAAPVSTINYLKPYDIYENVGIKSTEVKSGTSQAGKNWKSLVITFGNDDGIYNHSMFYPNEKNPDDVNRRTYDQPNGGKKESPSAIEELQNQIASIGFAFFPEDFTKLQQVVGKINTVDQLMEVFNKFINNNLDKVHTNMKLVGRASNGSVYATLPKFTGIAQATKEETAAKNGVALNEWYTWRVSPFGDNLSFSAYEQRQANEYHNAKPTKVDNSSIDTDPINNFDTTGSEDADFDSLLAGL